MDTAEEFAPLSVLVVEDHDLTRQGLVLGIGKHPRFQVKGEAIDGKEAVDLFVRHQPELVVMDIGLPVMDGLEAARQIKLLDPSAKIVILTSHNEKEQVFSAFTSGANAYCMKDIKLARLLQVLESVMEGAIWLDPKIAGYILQFVPTPETAEAKTAAGGEGVLLSPREQDVLQLLAQGLSNQEIGDRLCISPYTVKNHVASLIQKLAVEDRTQVAIKAIRNKLI